MSNELKLHNWVRRQLSPCDYQRIEGASQGFPDVNACVDGYGEAWLELKVVTMGRTLLRKEQFAWGIRRHYHGGRCFVVSWHVKLDQIMVWRLRPNVAVEPYGKYLSIVTAPEWAESRKKLELPDGLKTILFSK